MWELVEMVVHVPDLDLAEAACLYRLTDRADTTRECRYSINLLAKELRVQRREVFYLLRSLEERGLIERSHEPGKALRIKVLIEDVLEPDKGMRPVERDRWGHVVKSKRGYEKFKERVYRGLDNQEETNRRAPIALRSAIHKSTSQ